VWFLWVLVNGEETGWVRNAPAASTCTEVKFVRSRDGAYHGAGSDHATQFMSRSFPPKGRCGRRLAGRFWGQKTLPTRLTAPRACKKRLAVESDQRRRPIRGGIRPVPAIANAPFKDKIKDFHRKITTGSDQPGRKEPTFSRNNRSLRWFDPASACLAAPPYGVRWRTDDRSSPRPGAQSRSTRISRPPGLVALVSVRRSSRGGMPVRRSKMISQPVSRCRPAR
jgi:hypothetical protein